MKKSVVLGCGIMLAAVVVGCGSSGPDALMKEQISLVDQMTGIMDKVTDKKSFEEAGAKIQELTKRIEEGAKKIKGLPESELKAAEGKYKAQMEASAEKFKAAMVKAAMKAATGDLDLKGFFPK